MWSCWIELLQYLDMENAWLGSLEARVQASENLPESSEAIGEALEVQGLALWLLSVVSLCLCLSFSLSLSVSLPPSLSLSLSKSLKKL